MFALAASLMLLPAAVAPMQGRSSHSLARFDARDLAILRHFADPDAGEETAQGAAHIPASDPLPRRRVQPRVSKTRCVHVTCGPKCEIKGSTNERGERVYRMPSSPAYREARAEAMFCNATEAQAAGYREAART